MSNKIKDDSADREYFVIVPRLVWALSRSPYDYTLWCIIKDIAGEAGECILSTQQLAALAMMSVGKVKECREHLLSVGLLKGGIQKDPDSPQPVYHLRIPDIWEPNIRFSRAYPKIAQRIQYKEASPHEGSFLLEDSPHEGSAVKEPSPHETKKNRNNNHKEDPKILITNPQDFEAVWGHPLPAGLDCAPFYEMWAKWEQHRREKKARLTPTSVGQQIKLLSDHLPEACRILERSITSGWIGLFPIKSEHAGGNGRAWQATRMGKNLERISKIAQEQDNG